MLFLRSWLADYIDLTVSNQKLAEIITTKSSEVEEITEIKDYFDGKVLVGRVKNLQKHPQSNKLQIFDVLLGQNPLFKVQIVSAATNIYPDMLVVVALIGAKLPYFTVGMKKLAGVESQGICLGKSELALETNYSSGLWEVETDLVNFWQNNQEKASKIVSKSLSNNTENLDESRELGQVEFLESCVGRSVCELLPEIFPAQSVLDIKVLPDQISRIGHHLGMAIEIATVLEDLNLLTEKGQRGLRFGSSQKISGEQSLNQNLETNLEQALERKIEEKTENSQSKISTEKNLENNGQNVSSNLENSSADLLPTTEKKVVEKIDFADNFGGVNSFDLYNLKLEKAFNLPHFLHTRMFLTGRNLVGGVVDLSNYLLVDMGQPSHFFDADKV